MTQAELKRLRYPLGIFEQPKIIDAETLHQWIQDLEHFPIALLQIMANLDATQLNWAYRPQGWVIKQIVHHCADSHMNGFIRFKICLTEDLPEIRPFYEDRWADLADSLVDDIEDSLLLIQSMHKKWLRLIRSLEDRALNREFIHPVYGRRFTLKAAIGLYAWHSNHHLAHIQQALKYQGKFD